jgi:c-di-GMP-binding flagellar brake protein YcgR
MQERRRYTRIPECLQIAYVILPAESIKEYITKDISQGGIRFLTYECIPKGSCLKIRITFPKTLFSFEALVKCMWVREVAYSEEFEVVVEFVDLPPDFLEYLVNYIKNYLQVEKEIKS